MYVYIKSETEGRCWHVGFFHPVTHEFIVESTHNSKTAAAEWLHYLNGGKHYA